MSNKAYRYARGSVWWMRRGHSEELGSAQSGTRPVVIISNNERGRSEVVEVLTMTTADKSEKYPKLNIPCDVEGRHSYIQCNQHFTVPISQLIDYYCTLSSETIEEVNKGLLYCQGLEYLVKDAQETSTEEVLQVREKETITVPDSSELFSQEVVRQRGEKWTDSMIKEFVEEVSGPDKERLMVKWNFSSEKSMMNTYYKFKSRFAPESSESTVD